MNYRESLPPRRAETILPELQKLVASMPTDTPVSSKLSGAFLQLVDLLEETVARATRAEAVVRAHELKKSVAVSVTFFLRGARLVVPGELYAPIISFSDKPGRWSVVLKSKGGWERTGILAYLAEDAPHHELRPGRVFGLWEGSIQVGHGTILWPAESL